MCTHRSRCHTGSRPRANGQTSCLRCEPITTDADLLGNLYNPVCCVLGRASKFRIVIEPSGLIPDNDIVWHVSGPGAVTLSPASGTEVSVTPSVAGEYTLEVQIDGYDGPPPFIKVKGGQNATMTCHLKK